MTWTEKIDHSEIMNEITKKTDDFANRFGKHLGTSDVTPDNMGKEKSQKNNLTTNQLRKFFGEVKRQQLNGYNQSDFILLRPKLAYAVARAKSEKRNPKIADLFLVLSDAMTCVSDERTFKNFVKFFEAIVAYHKQYEVEHKKINA